MDSSLAGVWVFAAGVLWGATVPRTASPAAPLRHDAIPPVTRQRDWRLRVRVMDPAGRGLERINVWVNDVPVFGVRGFPLKGSPHSWSGSLPQFALASGQNKVQL